MVSFVFSTGETGVQSTSDVPTSAVRQAGFNIYFWIVSVAKFSLKSFN